MTRTLALAVMVVCLGCGVAGGSGAPEPAAAFTAAHPSSSVVRSADGSRLVHASGFEPRENAGARDAEAAARAFLASGDVQPSLGLSAAQGLSLRSAPDAGTPGAVRFQRTIGGLPVFGGDVVVGVDARNRVFLVNSGDVPPTVTGRHAVGETAADAAARASFARGLRRAGPATIAAGWRAFGPSVRAVYRVDFVAADPPGDWRVYVDGETGAALLRQNLRVSATAPADVFEISPAETASALCPVSGTARTACAGPVEVTLQHLASGSSLTGSQVTAFNCNGQEALYAPSGCSSVGAVGGGFRFSDDLTFQSVTDPFAAVMAYYHLDKHVSFFKTLDPALPRGSSTTVLRGSIRASVNTYWLGEPLDNAFFSPFNDGIAFGQGNADFAYDGTIAYHELTHAVVDAWGGFDTTIDAHGAVAEPGAVNEGTADAMAASETGRSAMAAFIAGHMPPPSEPTPALRDLSDPDAKRTCKGDGTLVSQYGIEAVNGLTGEVHDDGEIWNGFYWEVYQGLKDAGVTACCGACEAGPALQYKTLKLAAGTRPTLDSYWRTMKSAATALFPYDSAVSRYVECVAQRRKLDQCDRIVPVYAGEDKVQYIDNRYSAFQMKVVTTGAAQLNVCSAGGMATMIWGHKDSPVELNPATQTVISPDESWSFTQECKYGSAPISLAAGTWYLLLDSADAENPGYDLYRVTVGTTNVTSRPAGSAPTNCTMLGIAPAAPAVDPGGSVTFTASGGSGSGYAFDMQDAPSGGTIDDFGVYQAGPKGGVTDVVRVTDSAGTALTRRVLVGGGGKCTTGGGGGGGGCSTPGLSLASLLAAALGLAIVRRGRKRRV